MKGPITSPPVHGGLVQKITVYWLAFRNTPKARAPGSPSGPLEHRASSTATGLPGGGSLKRKWGGARGSRGGWLHGWLAGWQPVRQQCGQVAVGGTGPVGGEGEARWGEWGGPGWKGRSGWEGRRGLRGQLQGLWSRQGAGGRKF